MLMVISPAKALDFSPGPTGAALTMPALRADTALLAAAARRLTTARLQALMSLSDKLAQLNRERFQAFDPDDDDGLQAVFAFNGDVYRGLRARELDAAALAWAQDRLRILSGLYGVLRPLDAIQPYRLEMGSKLKTRRGADLYAFWGPRIAAALDAAVAGHADATVVDLASREYFAAVDREALKAPVITCHFKQAREGALVTLSFQAKRARGEMARFAIDHRLERTQDLKAFDRDGYRFVAEASGERDWVFARAQTAGA